MYFVHSYCGNFDSSLFAALQHVEDLDCFQDRILLFIFHFAAMFTCIATWTRRSRATGAHRSSLEYLTLTSTLIFILVPAVQLTFISSKGSSISVWEIIDLVYFHKPFAAVHEKLFVTVLAVGVLLDRPRRYCLESSSA